MNPNGRPKKSEEEKLLPASFRLPPATIEALDEAVAKEHTTRSVFLRQAIEEKINREEIKTTNSTRLITINISEPITIHIN